MKKLILLCLTVCIWAETGVLSRVVQVEINDENTTFSGSYRRSINLAEILGVEADWFKYSPVKYESHYGPEWLQVMMYSGDIYDIHSPVVFGNYTSPPGYTSETGLEENVSPDGNVSISVMIAGGNGAVFGGTLHISVDFPIEVNSTFLGDVNVDGETNITDIVILVNYIIGTDN